MHAPKDHSRIVILEKNLSNIGALALERRMIAWYGRIDTATGILRNRSDGGEGPAGIIRTEEHKRKLRGPKTAVAKANMSRAAKTKPRLVCTHCNISVTETNHTRWHGDNCKIASPGIFSRLLDNITCAHCGTTCSKLNHTRWHGDNCSMSENGIENRKSKNMICVYCNKSVNKSTHTTLHGDNCSMSENGIENRKSKNMICVYCRISCSVNNHTRWHGDNCKLSP